MKTAPNNPKPYPKSTPASPRKPAPPQRKNGRDFDWGPTRSSEDKLHEFLGWFVFCFFIVIFGVYTGKTIYHRGQEGNSLATLTPGEKLATLPTPIAKVPTSEHTPKEVVGGGSEKTEPEAREELLFSEKSSPKPPSLTQKRGLSLEFTFKNQLQAQKFVQRLDPVVQPAYLVHDSRNPKFWQVIVGHFDHPDETARLEQANGLLRAIRKIPGADKVVNATVIEHTPDRDLTGGPLPALPETAKSPIAPLKTKSVAEVVPPLSEEKIGEMARRQTEKPRPASLTSLEKTGPLPGGNDGNGGFLIQVGSFKQKGFAHSIQSRLEKANFDVLPIEIAGSNFKVQVGPYLVKTAVEEDLARIEKMGLKGMIVQY